MAKSFSNFVDKEKEKKGKSFSKRVSSEMHYRSILSGDLTSFEWLNEIELACPYIDNVIRNPKLSLIKEEDIVKIGKAKKITVDSIKDLSKHTQFIDKIDEVTDDVEPSKILIVRNEETFNTYENRFLYTLLDYLNKFIAIQEDLLKKFELKNERTIEYSATSKVDSKTINVDLKISEVEKPKGSSNKSLEDEIAKVKSRVKGVKEYLNYWKKSEIIKALDKAHVPLVKAPISMTNMLLKNPNFQIAMRLWTFLQMYGTVENDAPKGTDQDDIETVKSMMDDTFLTNYFALELMPLKKREQKKELVEYSVVLLRKQLKKTIQLLLNSGLDITEKDILALISNEIESGKDKRLVGSEDVKKKFKSALDEYLERTKGIL
ncbi:MAG: DUF2357 domain-containing protein [Bacilli bacterium]|nr:DUF2357 domain-containing protein [Bacilli bacterium]